MFEIDNVEINNTVKARCDGVGVNNIGVNSVEMRDNDRSKAVEGIKVDIVDTKTPILVSF